MLRKLWFNQIPHPPLADLIIKVNLSEPLTPIEELVYLMGIEEMSLEEAVLMVEATWRN